MGLNPVMCLDPRNSRRKSSLARSYRIATRPSFPLGELFPKGSILRRFNTPVAGRGGSQVFRGSGAGAQKQLICRFFTGLFDNLSH